MFEAETIRFLTDLRGNNTRDWFAEHRADYETHVAAPAKAFAEALAQHLGAGVSAKILRIHRDVRFSKDKTPYNPWVRIAFSDGAQPGAWFVGLDPDGLTLGFGAFGFDGPILDRWREAVAGPDGAVLDRILAELTGAGHRLDPPELRRVPAPFAADHPQGSLLRRKGLAVWDDSLPLSAAFGADVPHRIAARLAVFRVLHQWMAKALRA